MALVSPALHAITPADAAPLSCDGVGATIVGTQRADAMRGTPGPDVIVALGGDDRVDALGGADIVCGGPGNDVIAGGRANDSLLGQDGNDSLLGGPGADVLLGGPRGDTERGGTGNDVMREEVAPNGGDRLLGGEGRDLADYSQRTAPLTISLDDSDLDGGQCGHEGDTVDVESVVGGSAGDSLIGDQVANTIVGGPGNDRLEGRGGDDVLAGGPGDDVLAGGSGSNTLSGGSGSDTTCSTLRSCDVAPPELLDLSFSPTTIDTSGSSIGVHFTARVHDELSGPFSFTLRLESPSGHQARQGWYYIPCPEDTQDATVRWSYSIPRYSEQGTWHVAYMEVGDRVRNKARLDEGALATAGFPTQLEQTGAGDTVPPELQSLTVSPTSVDTSTGAQHVTIEANITDDLSGVLYPFGLVSQVDIAGPSGGQLGKVFDRISGDALDGVYRATFKLPQYAEQGTWTIRHVLLADQAGNTAHLYEGDLAAAGFPTTFEQTGTGDSTPPQLKAFSISPHSVDTSSGGETITFEARLTDDLSGLESTGTTGWLRFRSPSGNQWLDAYLYRSDRVAGDALDGTYRFSAKLPRFSEQGTWVLEQFWFRDATQNSENLSSGDLTGGGFPNSFTNGP